MNYSTRKRHNLRRIHHNRLITDKIILMSSLIVDESTSNAHTRNASFMRHHDESVSNTRSVISILGFLSHIKDRL